MLDLSRVQTWFMVEHRHIIVTENEPIIIGRMQALSSTDSDIFWVQKPCLSFWLWLENIWLSWIHILEGWSHSTSYLGYWHILHATILIWKIQIWMVKIFAMHTTCWTNEFETINKPKPSCRFPRWCPSRRFHMWFKIFFWLEGFRIKASLKSIVHSNLPVRE